MNTNCNEITVWYGDEGSMPGAAVGRPVMMWSEHPVRGFGWNLLFVTPERRGIYFAGGDPLDPGTACDGCLAWLESQ